MKQRHLELWKFQRRGQRFRGQQKGTHERVDCKVCPILEDSKYMLSEYVLDRKRDISVKKKNRTNAS